MLPKKYCLKIYFLCFSENFFLQPHEILSCEVYLHSDRFCEKFKDLLCNLDGYDSYKSKILSLTVFLFYFNKNTFQSE